MAVFFDVAMVILLCHVPHGYHVMLMFFRFVCCSGWGCGGGDDCGGDDGGFGGGGKKKRGRVP